MARVAASLRVARTRLACRLVAVLFAGEAAAQGECLLNASGSTGAPVQCAGSLPGVFICGQQVDNCELGSSPATECPTRDCGGFQTCSHPIVPAQPDFEIVQELDGTSVSS